ncbi:hypothetical protein [Nocardiopsis valliformis]|uniref:hypothetical protein n=1 Tax=Nocardiopsis valliformis TaxID=239974 RepID=UPI0003810762|nr:hypothetical protein [Nocardiopsis valliformis]
METAPPRTPGNTSAEAPARPSPLTLPLVLAGAGIAVFSAALIGFLGLRTGDTEHAGRVASGHLSPDDAVREVEALTWSWHMTQVAVALFCLVLSVVVGCLILRGREKSAS